MSIQPPVPMWAPEEYFNRPTSRASAVVSITSSRVTLFAASRFGIDLHLQHFQALAPDRDIGDPGTRSSRSSIFQ